LLEQLILFAKEKGLVSFDDSESEDEPDASTSDGDEDVRAIEVGPEARIDAPVQAAADDSKSETAEAQHSTTPPDVAAAQAYELEVIELIERGSIRQQLVERLRSLRQTGGQAAAEHAPLHEQTQCSSTAADN
jgi:hypothetical protein